MSKKDLDKHEKEQRKARLLALKKCPIRKDGIIQCPPRKCLGYGYDLLSHEK